MHCMSIIIIIPMAVPSDVLICSRMSDGAGTLESMVRLMVPSPV